MSKQLSLLNYNFKRPKASSHPQSSGTVQLEVEPQSQCDQNHHRQLRQLEQDQQVQPNEPISLSGASSEASSSLASSSSSCTVPDDVALTSMSSPCQPLNVTFPKRAYSTNIQRSFNPTWYRQYSWLEYSVKRDAVFCFPCRFFGLGSIGRGRPEKVFTLIGFRDWKHATGSKGALISHDISYSHKQSVIAWEQFKAISSSSSGSVADQLSGSVRSEMVKKNKHYVQAIADVLLTCTRQDIAHRETDQSLNRGNFLERFDPIVANRLQRGPQNALYTSHNIQNTFINIVATLVRKRICTSIERAGYYSLLVDETKDLSKDEQMSICIRYR